MKKTINAVWIIILLSFVLGFYLSDRMPGIMASHWGALGEVNGYIPKFWGLFLMPMLSVALLLLFLLIPLIDPLKANIQKFRDYYDWFVLVIIAFLFYIYILTLLWNLDFRFNMMLMLIPPLAIMFFYAGILMENAKRNWFIGVRTPWTLSNDKIWEKTNKLGGKLFKISGIITLFGVFLQDYAFLLCIVPILLASIYIVFYSYFEYHKLKKR